MTNPQNTLIEIPRPLPVTPDGGGEIHFFKVGPHQTLVSVRPSLPMVEQPPVVSGMVEPKCRPTLGLCLERLGRDIRVEAETEERPSFRLSRVGAGPDGDDPIPDQPDDYLIVGLARGNAAAVRAAWHSGNVNWAGCPTLYSLLTRATAKRLTENAPGVCSILTDGDDALYETEGFKSASRQVYRALVRSDKRAVVLTGRAGSGKSAFIRSLVRKGAQMLLPGPLQGLTFINFGIELFLVSHSSAEEAEKNRLRNFIGRQPVIGVLDEAGRLDAKSIDTLLCYLDSGGMMIMASDVAQRIFREREAFNRRVVSIPMTPPSRQELTEIGLAFAAQMEKKHRVRVAPEVVVKAVERSGKSRYSQPHALTDLISLAVSGAVVDARADLTLKELEGQMSETLAGMFAACPDSAAALLAALREAGFRGHQAFLNEFSGRLVTTVRQRLESADPESRPAFSCLLSGPSLGFLSTLLPRVLGGSRSAVINCASYTESHHLAALIGSPQGYIGYEDGGELENQLRNQAFIIVLKNPEAAHPAMIKFIRGLLDGKFTSGRGAEISLSHCLILVTTNAGSDDSGQGIGFGAVEEQGATEARAHQALVRAFGSDFLNAFDFAGRVEPLRESTVREILGDRIQYLARRFGRGVEITDGAMKQLLARYRPPEGLVSVLGPFRSEIEGALYRAAADGGIGPEGRVLIDVSDGGAFRFLSVPEEGGRP